MFSDLLLRCHKMLKYLCRNSCMYLKRHSWLGSVSFLPKLYQTQRSDGLSEELSPWQAFKG